VVCGVLCSVVCGVYCGMRMLDADGMCVGDGQTALISAFTEITENSLISALQKFYFR